MSGLQPYLGYRGRALLIRKFRSPSVHVYAWKGDCTSWRLTVRSVVMSERISLWASLNLCLTEHILLHNQKKIIFFGDLCINLSLYSISIWLISLE